MNAPLETTNRIPVALVTGQHPYDVPALHTLFRSIPDIDLCPQHMEDFVTDVGDARRHYQVVVFYNFHQATPGQETNWWDEKTKEALEQLGNIEPGIFILHHALLAFPEWPLWSELCGIRNRRFEYYDSQTLRIEIANPHHPITQGLTPWEMVDETYLMNGAGEGSEVLLTTDHPKSIKTIAWTRQYKNSRVFCLQSGHDRLAFGNPSLQTVVARALRWLAARV